MLAGWYLGLVEAETHWIIQGQWFSIRPSKKSVSVVQMFAWVSPGCTRPLLLPGWPWPSPQQQRGRNRRETCIFSLHAGVLHSAKNEYDCGELAAPRPTSSRDQFRVHHVPRLTGCCRCRKEHGKPPPAVGCFAFSTASVSVQVARQLLLSGFLQIYMVFVAAGEARTHINAITVC